jgi:hypothetical protein
MEAISAKKLDLKSNRLTVLKQDGKTQDIEVELVETIFNRILPSSTITGKTRSIKIYCYELVSIQSGVGYEWAVCSYYPLGFFSLHAYGIDKNYLAWTHGNSLIISEVTKPITRQSCIDGLTRSSPMPEVKGVRIPVTRLEGGAEFFGTHAAYPEAHVQSIDIDKDNNWTIKASGVSGKVYTFIQDKTEKLGWRVEKPEEASN